MVRIVADEELRKKLLNFAEDVEICDENGNLLAEVKRFLPKDDPSQWIPLTPEISDEEIERRLNSNAKTYTTQEVLDMLEKL